MPCPETLQLSKYARDRHQHDTFPQSLFDLVVDEAIFAFLELAFNF
jgi:hypothetical protein